MFFLTVNPPSSAPPKKHHKFATERWPPPKIPPSVGRCWNGKPENWVNFLMTFAACSKKKISDSLKQLRMEIYKFYQDSFSKEELAEIRALRGFLEGLKWCRFFRAEKRWELFCCVDFFGRICTIVPWQITVKPQFGLILICFPLFQIQEKTHHKKGMGKV